jgi:hypothetical protein
MSDIIDIANAVATALKDFDAEVVFAPDFELAELDTMRCVVVPVGFETPNSSRGTVTDEYQIQIGFMFRQKELDVANLLRQMKSVCRLFARFRVGDATCFKVNNAPLYDVDLLRQRNQFTSIVSLYFKEVCYV